MSMKLQICTDRDRKEAQNRERKRQCELERRSRIFNARARKIGVDVEFLNRQVQEKRELEDEQRRKDEAVARQLCKDSELVRVLHARADEERHCVGVAIDEYRKRYQRKQDSREYDLNDPDALKKQLPPRLSDAPVGLSSAQKFEGEDLMSEERGQLMAAQRTAWLQQQVQERRDAAHDRERAERLYMAAMMARDARAAELDRLERECRHRLGQANVKFNEALAAEKKQTELFQREQEVADNTADIFNNLTSDMLTENPDVAKSALGKDRAIGFMYKGMNAEELKKFRAAQMQQIAIQKEKREGEQKRDAEWQALAKSIARDVARADIQEKRKRKELAKQMMEDNLLLAMQQREKAKYFKEVVYNNQPTDDYYTQFNTTTR